MNASADVDKPDVDLTSNKIINKMKKYDSPKDVDQPQRPSNVMRIQWCDNVGSKRKRSVAKNMRWFMIMKSIDHIMIY